LGGGINGKGVICEINEGYELSYLFEKDEVRSYVFLEQNSEVKLITYDDLVKPYESDEDTIFWYPFEGSSKIDKTVLNRNDLSIIWVRFSSDGTSTKTYILGRGNCEVFKEKQFHNKLDKLKSKHQTDLDESLKDKKI
jgi:hypothetical protein